MLFTTIQVGARTPRSRPTGAARAASPCRYSWPAGTSGWWWTRRPCWRQRRRGPPLCQKHVGFAFGQMALRRLCLSARACRRLPQASASLCRSAARAALAGLLQAVFSTPLPLPLTLPLPPPLPLLLRPTTDAEFSLSTERQLDPDEEDGRLVTARDDGTETMQRNWPKPTGNW